VAVTPHVEDEGTKVVRRNQALASNSMVEALRSGNEQEKIRSEGGGFRSGAIGSGGQDTRQCKRERERHKMEFPLLSWSNQLWTTIQPGIYTPRLGHELFQHITSMARPPMDSVNTVIRCPYSTLPRNGHVPKNP
jgi:hypothetical protein